MAQYHVAVAGQQRGPYTLDQLRRSGISSSSLVWTEGMADWLPAGSVLELAPLLTTSRDGPPVPSHRVQYSTPTSAPAPISVPPYAVPMAYAYPPIHVMAPVIIPMKSAGVAFVLTFFFGPLGMLYSTVTGAVVMLLVSVVAGLLTLGLSFIITWPVCILWGCLAASNHNDRLVSRMRI